MSSLGAHLESLIRAQGPVTLARFMAEALGNPRHGYYMRGDPLGADGDFITAPEISQMFGELIGLWCAETWRAMGEPPSLNLVELGPGRGTLMADALRAAELRPAFRQALKPWLVETSPALVRRQEAALAGSGASWIERLADLPQGPVLAIANEFFDALPVRQFVRTEAGWCERLVDLDDGGAGRFRFVLSPGPTPASALIPAIARAAPLGSVAEVCPAALSLARDLGERVLRDRGAALIIDYGRAVSGVGESVQAVRAHRRHEVLDEPGSADITAHVDFDALGRAAGESGAAVHGPRDQGPFLRALGIETRAAALLRKASPSQRLDITSALGRLTDPGQMGALFKVLVVQHPRLPRPAGFEAAS